MEVGFVGEEVPGGDAAQRIVALELFDDQFDPSAVVVKAPEVEGLQRQVGHQDLVMIAAELEERKLLGGFFGLRAADHHETIGMFPASRLIAELGDLDPAARTGIAQRRQFPFDWGGQARHNDEPGPPCLQPLDERMVEKPFVGTDNHRPHTWRDLREARAEQVDDPAGRVRVARAQLAIPEVFALPLEAQQRMIRRPPMFDRIVADLRSLLLAVEDQHCRVDIENQPRRAFWLYRHERQKSIVQAAQLRQRARGGPQQKTAQGGGIGISLQAGQVLEDTIVPEQLSSLDPSQAKNHRIQESEEQFATTVAIVALRHFDLLPERSFHPDSCQKPMQEVHTAIVGQALRTEHDPQFPWPFSHVVEHYLKSRVRRNQRVPVSSLSGTSDTHPASAFHA